MRLARAVSGENREKGTAAGGFPGSSYRAGPVVPKRISACPSRPGRPLRSTWTEPFFRKIRLTWSAAGDPPAAMIVFIRSAAGPLFSERCFSACLSRRAAGAAGQQGVHVPTPAVN